MTFVHDDPKFIALLTQVSAETGIAAALVEKDDWITHSLWALHETKLDVWFKGGTSLAKRFKRSRADRSPHLDTPRELSFERAIPRAQALNRLEHGSSSPAISDTLSALAPN